MGGLLGAWGQSIARPLPSATETKLRAPVYHKHETLVNVQFSQVQLSQWAAGGQSSASLIAKVDQFWEYDGTDFGWDTEFHGAFGLLHRPDDQSQQLAVHHAGLDLDLRQGCGTRAA